MPREQIFDLYCPVCAESLLDQRCLVDGLPGLGLLVENQGDLRKIWLSPEHGIYLVIEEIGLELEESGSYELYCPHCQTQLPIHDSCQRCGADRFIMAVCGLDGEILPLHVGSALICSTFRCINSEVHPESVAQARDEFLARARVHAP